MAIDLVVAFAAAGIGVLLLAFLITTASIGPALWALGITLAVSPNALPPILPLGNETFGKTVMLGLIVTLWARLGIRIRWQVALMLLPLLVALVISVLPLSQAIAVDAGLATRAFFGYFLTVGVLLVRWRREHLPNAISVLIALPLISLVLGLALWAAGLGFAPLTGGRLSGALIAPHLALVAVVSVFAAFVGVTILQDQRYAKWLLVNAGITFLTLTRGAIIAVIIVVAVLGVWTLLRQSKQNSRAVRGALAVYWATVAVGLLALPLVLGRNEGNAYEGNLNTSGREQAWPFYLSLAQDSPIIGRGLGYASVANDWLDPVGVQNEFKSPHNEYIHLYVDGGLALAVPFFVGLVALLLAIGRSVGQRMAMAGVLLSTLVYSFVDNNFTTPQFSVGFALLMGALGALGNSQGEKNSGSTGGTGEKLSPEAGTAPAEAIAQH